MSGESNVKTVVIGVGPEDGLGAQLCARFLGRGHHVFMAGWTRETLEALARKFGDNATPVVADATDAQRARQSRQDLHHTPCASWGQRIVGARTDPTLCSALTEIEGMPFDWGFR